MSKSLYKFIGSDGTFRVEEPDSADPLYFPLANELGLLSAVTPHLHGDIKLDQHSFLMPPVSYEDLRLSLASRNFWLTFKTSRKNSMPWSTTGNSVWQKASDEDESVVEAGLLWHKLIRSNKRRGIQATTLSFVPAGVGTFEVMSVEIKNISRKAVTFTATSAIPLFGRSADNLRDHRHVTSLLNRMRREPFGLSLCPTMSFNERGHLINTTSYYVVGAGPKGEPPVAVFPTMESFMGMGGALDRPYSVWETPPADRAVRPVSGELSATDHGKEALGGLQFSPVTLKPGQSATFTLLLGIDREPSDHEASLGQFLGRNNLKHHWDVTNRYWMDKASRLRFHTGDPKFNLWIRWVQIQPVLRKIYGCSFLPDFDYGRGGRGWRDLWQDCLALLLAHPEEVREDIVHNYGGVRIDGSNATIIGRKKTEVTSSDGNGKIMKWMPEFIADRNNIVRTWMDHGVWPFLTTLLYLNQTGDWNILLESVPYFRDGFLCRGRKFDKDWATHTVDTARTKLTTLNGELYQGTVLEHILIQTLVPFFNVGQHNIIRLEDADWNDGLDMAHDRGESVAFTAMYAGNLDALAGLLEKANVRAGWTDVTVAEELRLLMDRTGTSVQYDDADQKRKRLEEYFAAVSNGVQGRRINIPISSLARDLREKAAWIRTQINSQEWLDVNGLGWYNGYYDNAGQAVEGIGPEGSVRMTLAGQVYPIMTAVAPEDRLRRVIDSVNRFLFDPSVGGIRLNTDFKTIQPNLGRAFSFAYGEKENGAVFSHMAVMYASALYQRGCASEGFQVLQQLYRMATDSATSQIYPGLPEYFNNEGKGRYSYLTGSASWYVLTLLTQAFGVRGDLGDLLIAPKLVPAQFARKKQAAVEVQFAGVRIYVLFENRKLVPYERMRIKEVKSPEGAVPFTRRTEKEILIQRHQLQGRAEWRLRVELDETK